MADSVRRASPKCKKVRNLRCKPVPMILAAWELEPEPDYVAGSLKACEQRNPAAAFVWKSSTPHHHRRSFDGRGTAKFRLRDKPLSSPPSCFSGTVSHRKDRISRKLRVFRLQS